MSFKIDKNNQLTYHHIKKREDGGKNEISNGAILTKNAHDFLHTIEIKNINIYNQINDLLKEINKCNGTCSNDYLEQIKILIIQYIDMGYDVPRNLNAGKIKKMMIEN